MADDVTVWFNPACSKCRGARDLLDAEGVTCEIVRYLDDTPSADEIRRVSGLLGLDSFRGMMRTGESVYGELGLADAAEDVLLKAMVEHPILIERPIIIKGDRAVIGRPPERLRELLD
jgi:arsenate reductase